MDLPPRSRVFRNQSQRQPQQPPLLPFHQDSRNCQNRNSSQCNLNSEINNFNVVQGRGGGGRRGTGAITRGNGSGRQGNRQLILPNPNYILRPMPANYQPTEKNSANRNRNQAEQNRAFSVSTSHDGQGSNSRRSCSSTLSEPIFVPNVGLPNQTTLLATEPGVYEDPAVLLASQLQSQLCIGSNISNQTLHKPFFTSQTEMNAFTGRAHDQAALTRPDLVTSYGCSMPCRDTCPATGPPHGGSHYVTSNQHCQQANPQALVAQNFGYSSMQGNVGMSCGNMVQNSGSYTMFTGNTNFNAGTTFVNFGGQLQAQPTGANQQTIYCAKCGTPVVQYADAASQSVQDGQFE